MSCAAVIVAGGMGTRLGKPEPKAYVLLGGKPLFMHSLELFATMDCISSAVLVVPKGYEAQTMKLIAEAGVTLPVTAVCGGAERWESVRNGVAAVSEELVAIHDAARPFVTKAIVQTLLDQLGDGAGVITANPVVDTMRHFEGSRCAQTVDRSSLIAVGTPQLFRRGALLDAYSKITTLPSLPTDEVMLLESLGTAVGFAYGDPLNFKVTTPSDFRIAEALITQEGA